MFWEPRTVCHQDMTNWLKSLDLIVIPEAPGESLLRLQGSSRSINSEAVHVANTHHLPVSRQVRSLGCGLIQLGFSSGDLVTWGSAAKRGV